jgi:hypothetical protein
MFVMSCDGDCTAQVVNLHGPANDFQVALHPEILSIRGAPERRR